VVMPIDLDKLLIRRTLRLALKGRGRVSPNPRVGSVIVAPDGTILGEGYHAYFGGLHAEVAALKACKGKDTRGATIYVNLEPCCFLGKTPACSTAIIEARVKHVVAATSDPDARVNGRGFAALREAGVKVEVGMLAKEARHLNRGYFSARERGRAWCAAKVALSLDGKMAATDGQSRWITGPETRKLAHAMRADHDAVMVGGGTVKHDDPELTVRNVKGPNPVRVILAPHFGIPSNSKLAKTTPKVRTVLVTTETHDPPGADIEGVKLLRLRDRGSGRIDPKELLTRLLDLNIQSLLIEGGSGVLSSFMQADLVDEISVGIAPSIVGQGISPFDEFIPVSWADRPRFNISRVRRYGGDIVITYNRMP